MLVDNPERSETIKVVERVLGVNSDGKNTFVSTYKGFVLQVDVDTDSTLIIVRLGKTILSQALDKNSEKTVNKYNRDSFLGTHIMYLLQNNTHCYTYRAPCWVDGTISESEFKSFLEHCNEEASECFSELVQMSA